MSAFDPKRTSRHCEPMIATLRCQWPIAAPTLARIQATPTWPSHIWWSTRRTVICRCVHRDRASSKPSTTPSGEAAPFASREGLTAIGVAPVPNIVWESTEVTRQNATMRTVRLLVLTFLMCCPREGTRC